MSTCFIIQPFDDGGPYDKRYGDVFEPAVREAGLQPYRVDHDPGVTVPINQIEEGIAKADVCLVDISLDNPNVWFELGYAIAMQRDVVLLCSDERTTPFPFDIQHRKIIKYATESSRDFSKLRRDITKQLEGLLSQERVPQSPEGTDPKTLGQVPSDVPLRSGELLDAHEVAGLKAMLEEVAEIDDEVTVSEFCTAMLRDGFTQSAAVLAASSLLERRMLSRVDHEDLNGNEYGTYVLTQYGKKWIKANSDEFPIKKSSSSINHEADEDLPF